MLDLVDVAARWRGQRICSDALWRGVDAIGVAYSGRTRDKRHNFSQNIIGEEKKRSWVSRQVQFRKKVRSNFNC